MSELHEKTIRVLVEQALRQADEANGEHVTIRVGVLMKLWEQFEERGEALKPFADLAEALGQAPDDKPVAAKVTCGHLRAAAKALE